MLAQFAGFWVDSFVEVMDVQSFLKKIHTVFVHSKAGCFWNWCMSLELFPSFGVQQVVGLGILGKGLAIVKIGALIRKGVHIDICWQMILPLY